MEWELKAKKLCSPWDRKKWVRNIHIVLSRAPFVTYRATRTDLAFPDAPSPFHFLSLSHITWHSLSNPSLLNILLLQLQFSSSQPGHLLKPILFCWSLSPLATGICPCPPLQLLNPFHKEKASLLFFFSLFFHSLSFFFFGIGYNTLIDTVLTEFSMENNAALTCLPSLLCSVKQKRIYKAGWQQTCTCWSLVIMPNLSYF